MSAPPRRKPLRPLPLHRRHEGAVPAQPGPPAPALEPARARARPVAPHAQPTGFRKGTLFVTVDSSVWLSEIVRYRKDEILERLQHSFGPQTICRISFRVG